MDWYSQESYCEGLPTVPVPQTGLILVTGATGYIGGRLVPELIKRGYQVRVMVRSYSPEYIERWPEAEVVVADALKPGLLRKALKGVSVAFYLMHSMLAEKEDDSESVLRVASNFSAIAGEEKLQRIIYLGNTGGSRSKMPGHHHGNRFEVIETLKQGTVPTTILRSGIVIGSGSASFEILNSIVRNSPVYFMPPWAHNPCQPISIRDVVKYLVGVLESGQTKGNDYDIGGEEVLTYREMIKILAKLKRKRPLLLPTPFSTIRLYSYIVSLISPVPAQITTGMFESVKDNRVVRDLTIQQCFDFRTIRYKVMLLRALSREEHDKIATRWSDAYPPAHELTMKLRELSKPPRYIQSYSISTGKEADALFESVCQIGGNQGWFNSNWMWHLRGIIDRVFMGVGTSRGRRSATSLRVNDVIDFWRVEEMVMDRQLLLRAEMRLPGKAWLDFEITGIESENLLKVTAYFQPRGVPGRLYWYFFLPFHHFIFKDLLKQLSR